MNMRNATCVGTQNFKGSGLTLLFIPYAVTRVLPKTHESIVKSGGLYAISIKILQHFVFTHMMLSNHCHWKWLSLRLHICKICSVNNQLKLTTLVYYVNNLYPHKLTLLIFAPEF